MTRAYPVREPVAQLLTDRDFAVTRDLREGLQRARAAGEDFDDAWPRVVAELDVPAGVAGQTTRTALAGTREAWAAAWHGRRHRGSEAAAYLIDAIE